MQGKRGILKLKAGESEVWPEIKKFVRKDHEKFVAIAYLSDHKILPFNAEDIVIVDASNRSIQYSRTIREELRELVSKATVYSYPNLHAKMVVAGDRLFVGSMNASNNAAQNLYEAAIITDDPHAIAQAKSKILKLIKQADFVDDKFLKRIFDLKIKQRPVSLSVTRHAPNRPKASDIKGARWFLFMTSIFDGDENEAEFYDAHADTINVGIGKKTLWIRQPLSDRISSKMGIGDRLIVGFESRRGSAVVPFGVVKDIKENKKFNTRTIYYSAPKNEKSTKWRGPNSSNSRMNTK